MNNLSKPDFSGQHIYVGMDVHKKSWSISIMTEHSAHKTFSQPPDPSVLSNYMRRNFPGATYHAAYEAGYTGFWIHDQLHEKGIDCMVVNPADVPTKDKERSGKKTLSRNDMAQNKVVIRSHNGRRVLLSCNNDILLPLHT